MDPIKFGEDLARKAELTYLLATKEFDWPDLSGQSLVFIGMGSSSYAAQAIVNRLQNLGHNSIFSLASNPFPPKSSDDKTLIAISATGSSIETETAFDNATGFRSKIWLTNSLKRPKDSVAMQAGIERGEVASLTYLATHMALLRLCEQLGYISNLERSFLLAAEAISDIYDRKEQWLPQLVEHISSPFGTFFIAPSDRICSAQQSALMMRECPRLPAFACETGDWAHVDVYLTKTLDYRAVLFPGSVWEDQFFNWTRQREAKVVTIGFEHQSAATALRYKNDADAIVQLLAEVTFFEVLAQKIWQSLVDQAP